MSSEQKETKPAETKTETSPEKPAAKPSPPEKKEPELPQFEKEMTDKVSEKFGDKVEITYVKPTRIGVKTAKENVKDVAEFIRNELNFDHAESVSGIDYPEDKEIEVVYHLGSYTDPSLSKTNSCFIN